MTADAANGERIVARIRTLGEAAADVLLVSQDRQATLVVIELTTSFLDRRNDFWAQGVNLGLTLFACPCVSLLLLELRLWH